MLHITEAPEIHHKMSPEEMLAMETPTLIPIFIIVGLWHCKVSGAGMEHIIFEMVFMGVIGAYHFVFVCVCVCVLSGLRN